MLANLLCLCKCLTLGQIKELLAPDANRRGVELVPPFHRFTRENPRRYGDRQNPARRAVRYLTNARHWLTMGGINTAIFLDRARIVASAIDPVLLDPSIACTGKGSSYSAFPGRTSRCAADNGLWVYTGGVNQAKRVPPSFETVESEATRTNFQ